jgi:ATP-dependent Clp protease ATP-binding subunit ClpA
VFERFTERARQVVVLAQDEARALKHSYIGSEHILLGLLREEEGLGARVLESLDVTVEEARAQVARIVGQGDEVATGGQIPFRADTESVLERALREALSLGHNYIGTEHILLGLVGETDGVAVGILVDLVGDAEKIRNEIVRLLAGPPRATERTAEAPGSWSEPFDLPYLVAALNEAKEAAIEAQEFDRAAVLRDAQRRLHQRIREAREELHRAGVAPPGPSRRHDALRWEYDVKTLVGHTRTWAAQLTEWRRDGWELLTVVEEDDRHRALLERRI